MKTDRPKSEIGARNHAEDQILATPWELIPFEWPRIPYVWDLIKSEILAADADEGPCKKCVIHDLDINNRFTRNGTFVCCYPSGRCLVPYWVRDTERYDEEEILHNISPLSCPYIIRDDEHTL